MTEINRNAAPFHRFSNRIYRFYCGHPLWCLFFVLSIISFLVYKDFILFQKLYIYADADIGSDLHNQTLPTLGYMADYIRSGGYPWWSFNMGLGQNVYASALSFGDPFISISILLGKSALPYSLGYLQAAKPIIAGLFFYLFLKKVKVNSNICFIVAILYSFSGHMIGRGAWLSYPNEVVWAAFVLYAIERCLADSDFRMLPLAVAIFFLSQKGYQSTLYTLYFFVYVLIRYFSIWKFNSKNFSRFIFKYIGFFALGAALAAIIFLPNLLGGLHSSRISDFNPEMEALKSTPIFSVIDLKTFFTTFYRTISMDALGIGSDYTGIRNYLEDPFFYSGTISVLLLPQVFFIKDKRKRNAILIMLLLALCYIFLPYVRYVSTGFARDTYKASSFIVVIFMLYADAVILENMICKKNIHLPILFATFFAGIGGLGITGILLDRLYPSLLNFDFNPKVLLACGLFILAYLLLLVLYKKSGITKRPVLLLLTAVVCIEAGIFSYHSVNNRIFLSNDFVDGKISYNDSTNDVVSFLKQKESGSFFRMETNENKYKYSSSTLCTSLYQNYYGVKSYTLQTQENLDFLSFVNAGLVTNPSNYVYSFNTRYALNSMLGVKYLISRSDAPIFPGYTPIGKVEDFYIFKNKNAFSLGTGYNQYVYASELENVGNAVRDLALLHAVALEDGAPVPEGMSHFDVGGLESQRTASTADLSGLKLNGFKILSANGNQLTLAVNGSDGGYLDMPVSAGDISVTEVSFKITSSLQISGRVDWIGKNGLIDMFQFNIQKGEAAYDFSGPSISTLRINFSGNNVFTISDIRVNFMPQSLYDDAAAEKKENGMSITSFSQNHIQGEIESSGNQILFLSIPFDAGWSAKVDGKKADIMLVDRGLMGIALSQGKHSIELSYTPPYLYTGSIVSAAAVMVYLLILLKHRQKKAAGRDS